MAERVVNEGDYEREMRKIEDRRAAQDKRTKIVLLKAEHQRASDPDLKAEIDREITEIKASD